MVEEIYFTWHDIFQIKQLKVAPYESGFYVWLILERKAILLKNFMKF